MPTIAESEIVFQPIPTYPRFLNLTGQVYGRLTPFAYARKVGAHHFWYCRCECQTLCIVTANGLRCGKTRSCGCLQRELTRARRLKHGHTPKGAHSHSYCRWEGMLKRCENSNNKSYKDYGARGIKVCERWHAFENFHADIVRDIGDCPGTDYSLDRINNDGDYEPGNVRWANRKEQARNRRSTRLLTYKGETLPMATWVDRFNIPSYLLQKRLLLGWSVEKALTTPVRKQRNNSRLIASVSNII